MQEPNNGETEPAKQPGASREEGGNGLVSSD
jgi:hypothetical protein